MKTYEITIYEVFSTTIEVDSNSLNDAIIQAKLETKDSNSLYIDRVEVVLDGEEIYNGKI